MDRKIREELEMESSSKRVIALVCGDQRIYLAELLGPLRVMEQLMIPLKQSTKFRLDNSSWIKD